MEFLIKTPSDTTAPWKLLLVDDEPEVHEVTRLVLGGFRFENRGLQFLSAHTSQQARQILHEHKDIAVMLLDVVMETDQAGLDLVRFVRDELGNRHIRIVLRTGQPGQAPEQEVIRNYDINDYKEKTELTSQKLSTTMYAALRAFRDITIIEASKHGLERVIAASAHIFSHEKTSEFASAVLAQLTTLVGVESGSFYCRMLEPSHDSSDRLIVTAATGDYGRYLNQPAESSLPTHIQQTLREAIDLKQHQFRPDHYVLHFTDSLHTESLLYVGECVNLTELDYRLIRVFCTNVSIGFENLHLNQDLLEAQNEMICILAGAAESRSQETAAHVRRVGVLAELLARAAGMGPIEAELIRHAAPLHDIGKIGIPDAILNKPGLHLPEETVVMRTHAQIGYQMLSQSRRGVFRTAAEIAISHHENWDGSGYPHGLSGNSIPLSGRITMLVDVFDALGSRRCYKEPWPAERIREFISAQRGSKFDPHLVDVLFELWEQAEAVRERLPD